MFICICAHSPNSGFKCPVSCCKDNTLNGSRSGGKQNVSCKTAEANMFVTIQVVVMFECMVAWCRCLSMRLLLCYTIYKGKFEFMYAYANRLSCSCGCLRTQTQRQNHLERQLPTIPVLPFSAAYNSFNGNESLAEIDEKKHLLHVYGQWRQCLLILLTCKYPFR